MSCNDCIVWVVLCVQRAKRFSERRVHKFEGLKAENYTEIYTPWLQDDISACQTCCTAELGFHHTGLSSASSLFIRLSLKLNVGLHTNIARRPLLLPDHRHTSESAAARMQPRMPAVHCHSPRTTFWAPNKPICPFRQGSCLGLFCQTGFCKRVTQ
jgi:hypothetical protein